MLRLLGRLMCYCLMASSSHKNTGFNKATEVHHRVKSLINRLGFIIGFNIQVCFLDERQKRRSTSYVCSLKSYSLEVK